MPNALRSLLVAIAAVLATAAAQAADLPKMVIATGVDPSFAHFYVGIKADIIKKNGVDAQLKTGPSGGGMIPLVISGQANAAFAATFGGLNNHLVDSDLVTVAQLTTYEHFYGILALKEFKSVADLKGRKVGITRGTASEALWYEAVKKFNLPAPYAELVYVEPPEMLAAIERGDIVAYSNWDPWISRTLTALPNTHLLMDNHDVMLDAGFLYMHRKWIEQNRDTAVKFMRAMVEAADFINQKPEETKKIVGDTVNLSPALMNLIMPKLAFWAKLDRQSYDLIKVQVEQLKQRGRITGEFSYDKYLYPDLLKAIDPSRVALPSAM
jgi:ABC-type nitrate/sulfonate/bicarbonate transport system substrate-binding protein